MISMIEKTKHFMRVVCGLAALAALLLPTYQIFARLLFHEGMRSWIYEVFVYLLVWATLLSGSLLAADGRHIKVDILLASRSEGTRRKFEILTTLISLCFILAVTWYGYVITFDAWDLGERSLTSLRFPMWMYYAALPVSCFLMSVFYVLRLLSLIVGTARIDEDVH